MDLLDSSSGINLEDPNFKIYSRNLCLPPHFIGKTARVKNSIIAEGCEVYGTVENSILFLGVTVEEGAVIRDSIVMHDCVIEEFAAVDKSILAENVRVGRDAEIGCLENPEESKPITVIGDSVQIPPAARIRAGEIIEEV